MPGSRNDEASATLYLNLHDVRLPASGGQLA